MRIRSEPPLLTQTFPRRRSRAPPAPALRRMAGLDPLAAEAAASECASAAALAAACAASSRFFSFARSFSDATALLTTPAASGNAMRMASLASRRSEAWMVSLSRSSRRIGPRALAAAAPRLGSPPPPTPPLPAPCPFPFFFGHSLSASSAQTLASSSLEVQHPDPESISPNAARTAEAAARREGLEVEVDDEAAALATAAARRSASSPASPPSVSSSQSKSSSARQVAT